MNIAIDARFINTGTGRYIERLVTYLEKIDETNTYHILVLRKDEHYWRPTKSNFHVVVADYPTQSFSEQFGFLIFLYRHRYDLVHFCMFNQPLLYFKKHITTIHDLIILRTYNSDKNWLIFHIKQFVARFVFYIVGKTSAHIITPSHFTKNDYMKFSGVNASRISVTYEAADKMAARPEPYEPISGRKFILYVGRQADYKNIKNLIRAHQLLIKKHPELLLVLAGKIDAAIQINMDWVQKNDYKNIVFTGFISDQVLAWLFQHCEVYAFPSLQEGFGLPGLEAMAEGAAVACSRSSCLPEVFGDAALYFDPLDTSDIANVIGSCLESKKLRKELMARSKVHAATFSWQRMAEQTHAIYLR